MRCGAADVRTAREFSPQFQHLVEGEAGKQHKQPTLPLSHWQWAQEDFIRLGKVSKKPKNKKQKTLRSLQVKFFQALKKKSYYIKIAIWLKDWCY